MRFAKRGSTLTRPDILAVLARTDTIIDRLQAGYRVNTRLVNFGLSIQGTFNGTDDSFEPYRHTLNITTTATTVAPQTLRTGAQMKKGEAQIVMPNPEAYFDFGSQNANRLSMQSGSINGTTSEV